MKKQESCAIMYSIAVLKCTVVLSVDYMLSRATAPKSRVALTSTVCIWLMTRYWGVKSGCLVGSGQDILTS